MTDDQFQLAAEQVVEALRAHVYRAREWALLEQVANGTGTHARRWADCVAMGLWPSRGMEIHGVEVKASLHDLRREIADPAKAEEVARFCDRWYVALANSAASEDGLQVVPPAWGIYVVKPTGENTTTVKRVREAAKTDAKPVSRTFVAAVLRRASEQIVPAARIEAARKAGVEQGALAEKQRKEWERDRAKLDLDELRQSIAEFEKRSGVKVDSWNGPRMGDAVSAVLRNDHVNATATIRRLREHAARVVAELDSALEPPAVQPRSVR